MSGAGWVDKVECGKVKRAEVHGPHHAPSLEHEGYQQCPGYSETTEKVEYRIWIEEPDGTKGQAYFLSSIERYDDKEKAEAYADSYNEGAKEKAERLLTRPRRYYVRTLRITETYEEVLMNTEDKPFAPGDWALHKNNDLDAREVHSVEGGMIRLRIGKLVTALIPAANYNRVTPLDALATAMTIDQHERDAEAAFFDEEV